MSQVHNLITGVIKSEILSFVTLTTLHLLQSLIKFSLIFCISEHQRLGLHTERCNSIVQCGQVSSSINTSSLTPAVYFCVICTDKYSHHASLISDIKTLSGTDTIQIVHSMPRYLCTKSVKSESHMLSAHLLNFKPILYHQILLRILLLI